MRNEELDKRIKEALSEQVNDIDTQDEVLKERVWNNIMKNVQQEKKKKKRKSRWGVGLALAAAIMIGIVIISANTEPVQVVMQSLRDTFVEKKPQEIEIEGQTEQTNTQLETNEELCYVIYIDEERYKMVKGEEADRIEMLEVIEGDFPEVYMEISRVEDTTTEEVMANIREEILSEENMGVRREGRVTEPIEAEMIQGMGVDGTGDEEAFGHEGTTPIHRYYVTDTQNNQVFVIKQVYFLEAAEGHGARFHYMLETFEIVE